MARHKLFDPHQVLEEAMLAFWRSGYDGTSTAELAARMRIGKRSMYDTFGDKHGLYLASVRHYLDSVESAKAASAEQAGSLREALTALLGPPPRGAGRPLGCFATQAAAEVKEDDAEVRELIGEYFERSRERAREQVRRFTGGVPPEAEDLVGIACDAALGYRVRARSGAVDPRQIDRIVDLVCARV